MALTTRVGLGFFLVAHLFIPAAYIGGPIGTPTGDPLEISLITAGANTVRRDMFGSENFIYRDNCALGLGYVSDVIPVYQINVSNAVTIVPGPGSIVTWGPGTLMTYSPSAKKIYPEL